MNIKSNVRQALILTFHLVLMANLLFIVPCCAADEFPEITIEINNKNYRFEVAATDEQRKKGLMFRKKLDENSGMLFVYPRELPLRFFMKNTYIPLDIAFIDENGMILNIEAMTPLDETIIKSKGLARYALEASQGFFDREGIKPGDKVRFLSASSDRSE
jgi:uncharacterized membrane protein (UPF0127 family)